MTAFDTHQRLDLLKRFLESLLAPGARVLDVGGYPGLLAERLGDDFQTITIDRETGHPRDYIRADAAHMPFADGCFDAAVASDVLEHIPPEDRARFIAETARVSRAWTFLGGPFHSPAVAQAEASLNTLALEVEGRSNHWLDQHAQHGLPDLAETRQTFHDLGFATAIVPNGSLFSWFFLKEIEFLLHALPDAFPIFDEINDLYIRCFSQSDHRSPTYRHTILAHRDPSRVEDAGELARRLLAPAENHALTIRSVAGQIERLAALAKSAPSASNSPEPAYVERLEKIIDAQEKQRARHEEEVAALRERLDRYESSFISRLFRRRARRQPR